MYHIFIFIFIFVTFYYYCCILPAVVCWCVWCVSGTFAVPTLYGEQRRHRLTAVPQPAAFAQFTDVLLRGTCCNKTYQPHAHPAFYSLDWTIVAHFKQRLRFWLAPTPLRWFHTCSALPLRLLACDARKSRAFLLCGALCHRTLPALSSLAHFIYRMRAFARRCSDARTSHAAFMVVALRRTALPQAANYIPRPFCR